VTAPITKAVKSIHVPDHRRNGRIAAGWASGKGMALAASTVYSHEVRHVSSVAFPNLVLRLSDHIMAEQGVRVKQVRRLSNSCLVRLRGDDSIAP
jgi:hypothetical protein